MKDVNLLINNGVNVQASLELLGDMDVYNETLEDFLNGIDEKVSKLKMYKEAQDMPNYAIYAHSLKSDAKYLGFSNLAEVSLEHELKSKAGNVRFVEENYLNLLDEINRITDLVNQYLGKSVIEISGGDKTVVVSDKAILIADDSNIIRNFVERAFSNTNFAVMTASDGQEAIDFIESDTENRIFGVLLDLNMPVVDGFRVLNYFKDNDLFKKIPISIITGDNSKEAIDKAFTYPIVDLLSKPFTVEDVKKAVEKIIRLTQGE